MPSKTAAENINAPTPKKKIGLGSIVIIIGLIVLAFIYHKFSSVKNSALNQDYYRVLYEASNKFNTSLNQLKSSHSNNSTVSAIRSILPSYKLTGNSCTSEEQSINTKVDYDYELTWNKILIKCKNERGTINESSGDDKSDTIKNNKYASLTLKSIMPATSQGFSQYLLVDKNKQVLSSTGKDNRVSIVDISDIQKAIEKNKVKSQWSFSKKSIEKTPLSENLPTMSTDIDLTLSSGEFRVFIFPFKISIDMNNTEREKSQYLYLVGLLPKQKLIVNGTGYWDLSLLVVTIACILFSWVILRLYLLPKNHVVTRTHRYSIQVISYFFFIVLVALILANMQKEILQSDKDQKAVAYLKEINSKLTNEITTAFSTLEQFKDFYWNLNNLKVFRSKCLANEEDESHCKNKSDEIFDYTFPLGLTSKGADINSILINHTEAFKKNINEALGKKITINNTIINKLIAMYQKPEDGKEAASFFHDKLKVSFDPFQSHFDKAESAPKTILPGGLLSIFALNSDGITSMPSITFKEIIALPKVDNLSHRDYYQLVRDRQGSSINYPADNLLFKNVHIQRLLNVADGTPGTTISMPMCKNSECNEKELAGLKGYVLGADVFFNTLSIAKPNPLDFTYMIINRNDGDVLFHNNEDRSMVENLFYASHEASNVEHWIKAGLDKNIDITPLAISGFYHGKKGRFFINNSIFEKWSIVVFYPNDSLDTLMTNEFLYVVICFIIIMIFVVCFLFLFNFIIGKSNLSNIKIKDTQNLILSFIKYISSPKLQKIKKGKFKKWAKVFSIYIACVYMLFFIINQFYLSFINNGTHLYQILYIALISIALFVFFQTLKYKLKKNKVLWGTLLLICMIHIFYFHFTALLPIKSLDAYYHNYQCSQTNLEITELNKIALMLFPNTVTQYKGVPEDLLGVSNLERCKSYSSEVTPNDLPSLSSLEGSRYFWRWAQMYLFYQEVDGGIKPEYENWQSINIDGFIILKSLLIFLLVILAWQYFQNKMLIGRVYCKDSFLKYIDSIVTGRLTKDINSNTNNILSTKLEIDMNLPQIAGVDINWLIYSDRSSFPNNDTLKLFPQLYILSPCLQSLKSNNTHLKNICLRIEIAKEEDDRLLNVYISEIETCLNSSNTRDILLRLLSDMKTLVNTNLLASFTLVTGFNTLKKVEVKALLPDEGSRMQTGVEYLSWSECLKDFTIKVPRELTLSVNKKFLKQELKYFPELNYLTNQVKLNTKIEDNKNTHWATLHYIHLCSEALFRFKWELCSNEEKLALYNLSNGHRLNPKNTQVIEDLAITGLIKVEDEHLQIINESFAEFVRNAESLVTINTLVNSAEQGLWRNYRLPFTLVIIVVIGSISLTSGESIPIILSSLFALITTVAGFANSANLIKGQLKE